MIFNSRENYHKTPYGAAPAGESVRFRIKLPADMPAPSLDVFQDSGENLICAIPMEKEASHIGEASYICAFLPVAAGLYFYRFRSGGRLILRDSRSGAQFDTGGLWQLTVYDPAYKTPAHLAGRVFYQIFPDRFCRSGEPKQGVPADRILHADWREEPKSRPDPDGEFRCNDYFGGDLKGIEQKLPYIASLGVSAIYLNPIFEAHSNHRYNTADYMKIDPLLGGEEDFRSLCAAAKKLGIDIILDGVFNHTGSDSLYFNKEGRYGGGGAWKDKESPYRRWYAWGQGKNGYASWWGFPTLPETNETEEFVGFICGEGGVIDHWIKLGASGWRLDVADELSDSFIQKIRAAVKAHGAEKLLLGEVWEDASTKYSGGEQRQYLMGRELDSVMNYPWRNAIIDFMRDGKGEALAEEIAATLEHYPPQTVAVLLNLLSTHDIPRVITALGGEPQGRRDRDWQREHNALSPEQYYRGRQLYMLASAIQFTLPGCPCLYYGDEAGLVGYSDPFNRGSYPWGREDTGLRDCIALLGRIRAESEALRSGSYREVRFDSRSCAYLREKGEERILVCVNRSEEPYRIPWSQMELFHAERLLTIGNMQEDCTLCGHSAAIYRLAGEPL